MRTALAAIALLIPLTSHAIVIRHDRDDAAFLDLADKYRCTVSFKDADPAGLSGMGTLIASQWVLTAAHVAAGLTPQTV
ncbi:MAG TPA: trypsin-like serine protease, partial [Steroidobacteraceae bacterium]|nr:trypsin-like serine protease [Steroidobacteraceae bacterium]